MPETMVRLIAPPGTDEGNIGTPRYRVHDDGSVLVPVLTTIAGFAVAPVRPALPARALHRTDGR